MSKILEDMNSWSFIQILNHPSTYPEVYIPPSTKTSSLIMSTSSLEMCTESLGNETGCYFNENMEERDISHGIQRSTCRELMKRNKRTVKFPPPLTSISGNERVRVRSHREGGRLVLRAVSTRACSSYFKAKRVNGTLMLSWRNDDTNNKLGNGEETNNSCKKSSEIGIPRRCKELKGFQIGANFRWPFPKILFLPSQFI